MSLAKAILTSKWYWLIVIIISLIIVLPFIFILLILTLNDPTLKAVATLTLVGLWGVAAGYTDWVLAKSKKERRQKFPYEKQ